MTWHRVPSPKTLGHRSLRLLDAPLDAVVITVAPRRAREASVISSTSASIASLRESLTDTMCHDWLTQAMGQVTVTFSLQDGWRVAGIERSMQRLQLMGVITLRLNVFDVDPAWHDVVCQLTAALRPSTRLALRGGACRSPVFLGDAGDYGRAGLSPRSVAALDGSP